MVARVGEGWQYLAYQMSVDVYDCDGGATSWCGWRSWLPVFWCRVVMRFSSVGCDGCSLINCG